MKFKRLWSCVLALAMMTTMVSFQASAYEGSTNDGGYTIDEPYEYPVVCILRRSAATGAVISGRLATQRPPVIRWSF